MVWETTASALIGIAIACAAVRRFPTRFPDHRLALATGTGGAMLGGLITRTVLGPGSVPVVLLAGALCGVVLLSLLVQTSSSPSRRHASGLAG
ncbi:hypothetical protein [Streptomyces otsuchiensis]|uniref:hypothetical protein n=1 Tax=Streptomyces otsuchiensis TaxID=2681388 RepID=UPI00102F3B53|nr:hypothetical protein [Streptomyces otsuchiensis]